MDANKVMKFIGIVVVVVIVIMIATGNMGGAKNATANYHSVMGGN